MASIDLRFRNHMSDEGHVEIPAAIREELGIGAGQVLDWRVVDGEIRVSTLRSNLRRAQERARQIIPAGVSLADELSAERREAAKHE